MVKKVFKGIIATAAVALLISYGVSRSMNNSSTSLKVSKPVYSEASMATNILDIFESNRCVCKHGTCANGCFVSFRAKCGYGDSDSQCKGQEITKDKHTEIVFKNDCL